MGLVSAGGWGCCLLGDGSTSCSPTCSKRFSVDGKRGYEIRAKDTLAYALTYKTPSAAPLRANSPL